ncbi:MULTISPECIES: hypothetical protein [Pseudonocardia]|uniref:Uncharacterized protein n=1 Tax=Pseudonocardia autotrophica TaxID=2074 RepID=A0A1Y2MLZ3_PSEAH|nr:MULTISPECIES: hypothetical protein [Pseudonocardia]OSY36081.1 hypothetical protein BG845_05596 [Pseudonocardia autotrophica]TDN77562.1 hypothetical protein C8E95_6811 [Pseudonocardia autotrophica]
MTGRDRDAEHAIDQAEWVRDHELDDRAEHRYERHLFGDNQ